MKRTIISLFMFLCISFATKTMASEITLTKAEPIPPGPRPLSLVSYPVSASIEETSLFLYFDWSVGFSTITVYDSSNTAVYQTVVDTSSTLEVTIPVDYWDTDTYKLTVSYGATNLYGYFQIP